jgi:hypothetical protein
MEIEQAMQYFQIPDPAYAATQQYDKELQSTTQTSKHCSHFQ